MMVLILSLLAGLVPGILYYIWLRGQNREEPGYTVSCRSALITGILTCFPIILLSLILNIFLAVKFRDVHHVLYEFLYNFIAIALSEEAVKDLSLSKILKKCTYDYSWRDVVIFMVVVGLGFGLAEDVAYVFDSNPGQMLVRGLLIMHAGYAFIFGYFAGMAMKTGKKIYYFIGFIISHFIHGLYDFTLDEGVLEWNDNLVVVPVLLAVVAFILDILLTVFIIKSKDQERYSEPLFPAETKEEAV